MPMSNGQLIISELQFAVRWRGLVTLLYPFSSCLLCLFISSFLTLAHADSSNHSNTLSADAQSVPGQAIVSQASRPSSPVPKQQSYDARIQNTCSKGLANKTACFLFKQHLTIKANMGDPKDQYQLATFYANGALGFVDRKKAVKWHQEALGQSYLPSYVALGRLYESGFAGTKDLNLALHYFRRAAESNNMEGQYELARVYTEGMFLQVDYQHAVRWLKQSARQGYGPSQIKLAQYYQQGLGVEKNLDEAARLFLQAAEQGYAIAQFSLALLHEEELVAGHSLETAVLWLKEAAKQGSPQAQSRLAVLLLSGAITDTDQNPANALLMLRRAADQHHHNAMYALGMLYYKGEHVQKDKHKALHWFSMAARQSHSAAMSMASELKTELADSAKVQAQAKAYGMENKAWLGDIAAQVYMAKYYEQDEHANSSVQSRFWLARAEAQGYSSNFAFNPGQWLGSLVNLYGRLLPSSI